MTQDRPFQTKASEVEVFGTPLRRFKGKLMPIAPPQAVANRRWAEVKLQFMDIEILPFDDGRPGTLTPYQYPVAELTFPYITSQSGAIGGIGWGGFLRTLEQNCKVDDIKACEGKVVLMEASDETYKDRNTDEERRTIRWAALDVEGMAPAMSEAEEFNHLIGLIDGKDDTAFATSAFQDPVGRKHTDSILNGSFVKGLLASGKITQSDDGKYHRASAG